MKAGLVLPLFAGLVAAHSGVWNVEVDGNMYPARDARFDGKLGAKRIEWGFTDSGVVWAPVKGLTSQGMACGDNPNTPALKAFARPGAKVTIQWSQLVRTHYGPALSYLAPFQPGVPAQQHQFFKIWEAGYNTQTKLWINEEIIKNDRKMTFQLPSDLKAGVYVLRSELIALHYSSTQGPQVYPHCFNIHINGTGTAVPKTGTVKFPGGYAPREPALTTNMYNAAGKPLNWESYKIPGPPKYAGKYEAPTGPKPVVSDKDRGVFPPAFQAKYDALKKKWDQEGLEFGDKLNAAQDKLGHDKVKSEANLGPIFAAHFQVQRKFETELAQLKKEAQALGVAN